MHRRAAEALVLITSAAVLLSGCKACSERVVETSIKAAKETTKGVEEGIDKGRKEGESLDGAAIVSSPAELAPHGTVSIWSVGARGMTSRVLVEAGRDTVVELAFENTSDRVLRVTKLSFYAIDKDGFAKAPTKAPLEVTVPPKTKSKVALEFDLPASSIAKVRVWTLDLEAKK